MATKQTTRTPDLNLTATIRSGVQTVYNTVLRKRLPRRLGVFNGIPARGDRLLDTTRIHPDYEAPIITSLREHVHPGDDVLVVGGGYGITSVAAARATGPDGDVLTYEASKQHTEIVRETARLNDVADRVTARHAVIGDAVSTRGPLAGADAIDPTHLPTCDVLELDCEGAEIPILRQMEYRPPVVIVESHGFLDSPTVGVRAALRDLDYTIVREEPEDARKDVIVLTAIHDTADRESHARDT